MTAEILTYSRSRGVFAGVALDGATLRPDSEGNKELYGDDKLTTEQIVMGKTKIPEPARPLIALLNKYSRVEQ
jgi:lipid-binding SYLF domain-containing protein